MENIKLYDIHGSKAKNNFDTLITHDDKYFYWDYKKFKKYEIGDFVFWINRPKRIALCTRIDSTDISPSYNDGINTIDDIGYKVSAKAGNETQFPVFYRFKIIEKTNIPKDWHYENDSTFATQTMAYILYEPGVKSPGNRISKIKDIKKLFSDNEEIIRKLNMAIDLLSGGNYRNYKSNDPKNIAKGKQTGSNMKNILTAIKTKPFILLAGLSGTGKSRLVRTLAFKTCKDPELRKDEQKPGNFELIPVRPNWHDSTELMGYVSRINGEKYIVTDFLRFIAKAVRYPEIPFFLCLDEMNLAPVEQYFAEYLSIIETRQRDNQGIKTDFLIARPDFGDNDSLYDQILSDLKLAGYPQCQDGISIPENMIVMGTVNMDETTHSFSRKVLDRAMTFEMNMVDLHSGLTSEANDWSYPREEDYIKYDRVIGEFTAGNEVYGKFSESEEVIRFLEDLNRILEDTPFKIAYRVRDEFLIYCYHASKSHTDRENWLQPSLDLLTSMKVLSRIEGDQAKTETVITRLLEKLKESDYSVSHKKLQEMKRRLRNGYTSFWS